MEVKTTAATVNFNLLDQIGGGGEGNVFRAKDLQLDAIIAIKKIPKTNFTDESKYFDESKKLYATEHTFVVPVKYGCRDEEHIYLAMPFYENGSLKSLTDKRFLTTREIVRYSIQFLSGLNNVHSKGLLHFDVKTENILLNDANQACISDFGLAQYAGKFGFANINGTTLPFAPPEYFKQVEHNLKYDVYQAGVAVYRMCNGDGNFNEQAGKAMISLGKADDIHFINNVVRGNFPDRGNYLPHIPKKMRLVVNKAMNADPNKRYGTVLQMLNDINQIMVSDWEYSNTGLDEIWKKGSDYIVTCLQSGGLYNITATKKSRKNHTFSKKVSLTEKNAVLYNCLNSRW